MFEIIKNEEEKKLWQEALADAQAEGPSTSRFDYNAFAIAYNALEVQSLVGIPRSEKALVTLKGDLKKRGLIFGSDYYAATFDVAEEGQPEEIVIRLTKLTDTKAEIFPPKVRKRKEKPDEEVAEATVDESKSTKGKSGKTGK